MAVKDLIVRILVDDGDVEKFEKAGSKAVAFSNTLDRAAMASAAVLTGVAAAAIVAGNAASDAEQAAGSVESIFAGQAEAIKTLAADTHDAVTLTSTDYMNLAAVLGAQLKNLGIAGDDLAGQTATLMQLGSDMSATFGGTAADAVSALSALLRGERDPIERYGVSINESVIAANALSMGIVQTTQDMSKISAAQGRAEVAQRKYNDAIAEYGEGSTQAISAQATLTSANASLEKALQGTNVELTAQQKAQVTLAVLMKQTADAQGQSAREADTAAGAQARMNEAIGTSTAQIGAALLPLMAQGSAALAEFARWAGDNVDVVQNVTLVVAGLAAGILALSGIMKGFAMVAAVVNALKATSTAAWIANTGAMIANKGVSIALMALYAKDFVVGLARTAAGLAVNSAAWVAHTTAVGAARVAMIAGAAAQGVQTAAQWANNAAWLASPITWIILAIIAAIALLVAAGIWLYENWDSVLGYIEWSWNNTLTMFRVIGDAIASWWNGFWGWIGDLINATWGPAIAWAQEQFRLLQIGLRIIGDGIASWWGGLWSGIGSFFSGIWSGFGDVVRGAWNAVIGWIESGVNRSIGLLNGMIRGVNAIGGAIGVNLSLIPNVSIPRLYTGGITTGPTLAMVGDNPSGREAIIPLDSPSAREMLGGGGGSDEPLELSESTIAKLARAVAAAMRQQRRQVEV